MNKYVLQHTPTMGVFSDTPIIEGKSGVEALNNWLPLHMIGVVKRVRGWEEPEYCLQRIMEIDGEQYLSRKVWYKYHHPKIERITK